MVTDDKSKSPIYSRYREDVRKEYEYCIASLKKREDYRKEFEPFLETLTMSCFPEKFLNEKLKRPCVGLYCVQAPLELFDSLGFHPIRLCNASQIAQRISSASIPVLTCPFIKSFLGSLYLGLSPVLICDLLVIPTTCDWAVKLPRLIQDRDTPPIHCMDLPHGRHEERGGTRWLEEIIELKKILQKISGKRVNRKKLLQSIHTYTLAWNAFEKLIDLKRTGTISGVWSIILANSFLLEPVEKWTEKINHIVLTSKRQKIEKPGVFLVGTPVYFPYVKIAKLIEEAGMFIAADDLCTSERIMKTPPAYNDLSEYGLLQGLAESHRLPCSCPTFLDYEQQIKNCITLMRKQNIKGVVYHILKGCHPFDIEVHAFEKAVKEQGFHFIKIETDFSRVDSQNISIRLEAFKETLHNNREDYDSNWN